MPARLVRPTVGLMPTTPLALAGHTMLPSVSGPNDTAVKFDDTAAAEPGLDPQGLRWMRSGLFVCPPRPDHPLTDSKERKLAHSDRFVFPRMTAPPPRRLAATVESVSAGFPSSANDPAVVCIMSPVSTLSFSSTGIPCKGPSTMPCLRNWSAWRAISSASGFSSITELTPGPFWSSAMMRLMYSLVNSSEVSLPEAISAWSWATVASLCRVGTLGESLFCVASFAAATGSASKAARRRVRTAGTIIFFLLGVFGRVTPGILLLWIWIVKRFPQISGFKCHNDVKTLWGGRIGLSRSILTVDGARQALFRRECSGGWGLALANPETPRSTHLS